VKIAPAFILSLVPAAAQFRNGNGQKPIGPMSVMNSRRIMISLAVRRVDHLADLSDLGCRKTADLRVLADDVLVFGEIDAERLVVGDIGFKPLHVRAKLAQYSIRFCR